MPPLAPFVIVLGIAQDAGHPQAGCDRDCCRAAWADPALRHHPTAIAVVDPRTGKRWLFDATPDLPAQLRIMDEALSPDTPTPDLDGVFLTHAHIGHYTGLVHLGREVIGADGVPVWAMPRMTEFIRGNAPWSLLVDQGHVALQPLADGQPVHLADDLVVTPFLVPHRDELSETVGFKIEGPSKTVAFLPDIDKWEKWGTPVEDLIRDVDVAWLDGTFYADGEIPRDMSEVPHPFIQESLERLGKMKKKQRAKVRFIHLNHTNPALDPQSEAARVVEDAGFRVAVEGERVEL